MKDRNANFGDVVGIVILNYNNAGYTLDCTESILRFNTAPVRIVVVDNASTDGSVAALSGWLEQHPDTFTLLEAPSNGGYARGNNIGLEYFDNDGDIDKVMILNNDVLFTEDIIPVLSDFIDAHPEAGLVSPLLRCRDGHTPDSTCARRDCSIREIVWTYLLYFTDIAGILSRFSNRRKMLLTNPELLDKEYVGIELPSGSCMMIRKDLFREIGWFDPNTFLYYEENILYRKLLAKGKQNYMLPGISCIHLGGVTTNKVNHSAQYMKASKASGHYYAKHYRNLNLWQKVCLDCASGFFNIMVGIVKAVKKLRH